MRAVDAIQLQDRIIDEVLRKTYDPEIPVNIFELGLIYEVKVDPETGVAYVKMTLTSPGCPAAGTLPGEVEDKIRRLEVSDIKDVKIEVTWEPPWEPSKMSESARLQLGIF
ncbi:MAG: DUF59 domain-containing protein [Acidobacteria bacterium]|nr:DUF59 domain-containing protein [Acidobacteriota bacterium]